MVAAKHRPQQPRFVAYLRVSTERQGLRGLGIEAQHRAIAAHVERAGGLLLAAFQEVESGRRADRPELRRALAHCRRTGATLLVAKLDRLARNVAFISNLMEGGVDFVAADMPVVNRLTLHILAAVAEEEARMISARVKAALAAAKARGVVLGNPRLDEVRPRAAAAAAAARREAGLAVARRYRADLELARRRGAHTLRAICAHMVERGLPPPGGDDHRWHPKTVQRLIRRLDAAGEW